MLALRLARGAGPLALLRRLLVAAASAGVGFLLLSALTYAIAHPGDPAAVPRLSWCLVPLAAAVHFAVAVARTDPGTRPRTGLSAVGLGPARLAALAASSTALAATLGSAVALLLVLHLRGDLTGLPFDGAGAGLLAAGRPLPLAAALTLLAVLPLAATVAAALVLRARAAAETPDPAEPTGPAAAPGGLPWGCALTTAGLAIGTYAARLPLPEGAGADPAGVLAGWALTAAGLAVAGPALTHAAGRLLQTARPGAVRLLAGRVLMAEARRIGRPLGVVCAVASAAVAAVTLAGGDSRPFGPLTGLGATLVIGCTTATLLVAAAEARALRTPTRTELRRLGAPASALRSAAALRAFALLAVFAPLTWTVATLAAVPLAG
ncbi:hypothetical protein [Streptomyces qinzhouensis]|uniref:Uncharacterized protein n=1 Tax=Streptomyces qinzhouensis TaxID=2599401 RepID=A0A5B8IL50_9ACTN|nr:hypothetical protein [Streptomyces qinzhouensis]QDY79262.1 hypothetical protein FQU76_25165 [Streptomyces qinzhouensis]